ncbi:MAG TPA: asparagine synthase (glutamine-hydrolyzing) [Candidatus Sulfotelmatobacter sp.]|nr:asparagine synthase (glutamine-hydrolyzing) [Candidatus Sulfotelmatobacter sp.]
MCGIFGIVARNACIPDGVLERGTQSLAHRGPDDSGTILLRDSVSEPVEIGLGNRRLAILDLSALAHQPMHDAETGNWIVYNGEIYNFREVRNELEQAGTSFVSHSDTEVLLKAYARWSEQCLAKFRGMFAFALWDAPRHRLFIARDPMGIKPLYYAQAGSYFLFASEVRTILGTGLVRSRIDPAGLINYLTFGSAYDPLTLVEGVRALPPGNTLTWEGGVVRQSSYWDLVDDPAPKQASASFSDESEKRAAERLQPLLEESVRLQLVSDVPVGVFLSGGIDSSALVSILRRSGVTASTFSIVFREADFSEVQHSRAVAAKFHTDHHEINVSEGDVLAAIPDALGAMDLPTMDGVNTYFVSRETRRAGVKVALSGLGGDEVFAGYSTFRTVPRMERFARFWKQVPELVRGPLASAFSALAPANDQNRKLAALARDNGRLLHPYFLSRMLFTPSQRNLLLRQKDLSAADAATASQRDRLQRTLALDPVNRVSYLESRCYMLNTVLRDVDFMSMSQGLEVRVPLIDHQLAKAVLALPGRWKLNGTPKKLLVGALAGSLPDEIVHRPKRGFTLPFEHWMRQELRSEIEPVLDAKRISDGPLGGWLAGEQVRQIWQDFLEGAVSWSRPWSLYVLQRWCELHLA